ncbi:ABC transporter substrate-binding protein [Paenibacillus sp. GCM10023252]|uniref:ABC transporter substrate-binding protein n=1 Tax=Paenibacillus sp. GCM10023252 TaxID=3252649 RepID=UPI00361E865D
MTKKKPIFTLLIVLLAMIVAAGCGASNAKNEEGTNEGQASTTENAVTYPITIKHMKGETVVEKRPERVAAADFVVLEHMFALDRSPVATGNYDTAKGFPIYQPYLEKYPDIIALSSDYSTPLNYEKLLESDPDLIIAYDWANIDYDKASKIAPTIVIDSKLNGGYTDGKDAFSYGLEQIATAIDAKDAYAAFTKKFNDQVAATKKIIEDKGLTGKTVLFLMAGEKTNYVYDINFYYEKFGLAPVKELHQNEKIAGGIDLETLVKANPDLLFLAEDYTNRTGAVEKLKANEAFKQIAAAKNGQVYDIDTAAFGPTAVGKMYGVEWIGKIIAEQAK